MLARHCPLFIDPQDASATDTWLLATCPHNNASLEAHVIGLTSMQSGPHVHRFAVVVVVDLGRRSRL
jgi:hypothetical protein